MAGRTVSVALHVGAHKTATTHLQKTLIQNRPLLAEAGLRVLTPDNLRKPGRSINDRFGINGAPEIEASGIRRLRSMLPDDRERLVLSEENFIGTIRSPEDRLTLPLYPKAAQRIAALVDKLAPAPVDVFLAVREPSSFLTSCYGQFLLGGHMVSPAAFFLDHGPGDVDWVDLVRRIRAVPGLRMLGVWPYESYPRNGLHLFRAMLRWRMGRLVTPPAERSHRGLSEDAVRAALEWHDTGQEGDLAHKARTAFPTGPDHARFDPFPEDMRVASGHRYHNQLREIRDMEGVTYLSYLSD
ncbi:MAG: hypothetical protein CSA72_06395 [Rhodobacterales bacterium]|nr:MAG: hypothetical protein CSA72_06395 [Rhodobacterales bacterium]